MWVSACGCTTIAQAVAVPHLAGEPLGLTGRDRATASAVSVLSSSTSPVLSSRQKDGMTTRCPAPMAWVSAATSATCAQVFSHTVGPWCSPVKTVPAETRRLAYAGLLGEARRVGGEIAVRSELDPLGSPRPRPRRGSAARGPGEGRRGTRRPRSRGPNRSGCGSSPSSWGPAFRGRGRSVKATSECKDKRLTGVANGG